MASPEKKSKWRPSVLARDGSTWSRMSGTTKMIPKAPKTMEGIPASISMRVETPPTSHFGA